MISAGIEGGCKSRIEEDWDLHDVVALRAYWSRSGPPLHIAVQVIGQSLGIDWNAGNKPEIIAQLPDGPSVAELAASGIKPL